MKLFLFIVNFCSCFVKEVGMLWRRFRLAWEVLLLEYFYVLEFLKLCQIFFKFWCFQFTWCHSDTQKSQFFHKTLLNHPHYNLQPPKNASPPHSTPSYSKNQSLYFCRSLFLHLEAKTTIATKLWRPWRSNGGKRKEINENSFSKIFQKLSSKQKQTDK